MEKDKIIENNKIDVTNIMIDLENELIAGLKEKRLKITDISKHIGEALRKTKEKVMEDVGKIVSENACETEKKVCPECGEPLKKTKKLISQ